MFFISGALPLPGHGVRAPTVVTREALRSLSDLGHELVFQPLPPPDREPEFLEAERQALDWARASGIELLPSLDGALDQISGTATVLARQGVSRDPEDFYPVYALRHEIADRVRASGADVVLHLWTPPAFAACAAVDKPVFAFAGNPDHQAFRARLRHPELFEIPNRTAKDRVRLALWKRASRRFEGILLDLARRTRWIASVSAPNAEYLTRKGHPRSFYIQNMWPKLDGLAAELPEPTGKTIVGNIGAQSATGNTFGVRFLGREILPHLDRLAGSDYEVSLFGSGRFLAGAAEAQHHPRVTNVGYVDDIDAAIRSAKVFLLGNNSHPDYVVGHTRVLHAWSLGACLVAHRGMAAAMPEIVHGENALLGQTGEEMAHHVASVLTDDDLRRRIAQGGRDTWEREFLPPVVMRRAMDRIERDLA